MFALSFGIKGSLILNLVLFVGVLPPFNVEGVDDTTSIFYRGHLLVKVMFSANVDCVMSLMWS